MASALPQKAKVDEILDAYKRGATNEDEAYKALLITIGCIFESPAHVGQALAHWMKCDGQS